MANNLGAKLGYAGYKARLAIHGITFIIEGGDLMLATSSSLSMDPNEGFVQDYSMDFVYQIEFPSKYKDKIKVGTLISDRNGRVYRVEEEPQEFIDSLVYLTIIKRIQK